jgi:OTU domain-containing protein 3
VAWRDSSMGKTLKKNPAKSRGGEGGGVNTKAADRLIKKQMRKKAFQKKDYQSNEEVRYAAELLKEGYQIEYIDGDGNCLFRSISDQLYSDQSHHLEIRHQVMNYIHDNQEHFQLFIEDDEPFGDYLDRLRCPGEWGGHQELFAASQILHINIHVHQLEAPQFLLAAPSSMARNPIRNIHISYHGEYHYNSLRPTSTHHQDLAIGQDFFSLP